MEAQRSSANVFPAIWPIVEGRDGIDVKPASALSPFGPGPTSCVLRSSKSLQWCGILLETHLHSPGERISASMDTHVVSMSHGVPFPLEHRSLSGEFVTAIIRPRTIMTSPVGPVPDLRLSATAELTHCALDTDFICGVTQELDLSAAPTMFRTGIHDKSIQSLMAMLLDELDARFPLGRLYVDSLAHALATRYILLGQNKPHKPDSGVTGLVPRVLRRVCEKIEANLHADLTLETLAEESRYSRAHFLRMFRAATGLTPHQYVLDLRLKRAQEQLKQSRSSIIDIALNCGFSSQSHMTSVFRQRLEITPGQFRRNV